MGSSIEQLVGVESKELAGGAEEEYIREVPEVPVLMHENLRSLEGRDLMAAALLSVVSSLSPSEAAPVPASKAAKESQGAMVANAKVKAWRRAGRKEKERDAAEAYPMFGNTWGERFEVPYGEISTSASNDFSEWEPA